MPRRVIRSCCVLACGHRFRKRNDEDAFELLEVEAARAPVRLLFMGAIFVWVMYQGIAGIVAAKNSVDGIGTEKAIRNLIYQVLIYGTMAVGAAGWIIAVCSNKPRSTRWRHVSASFASLGLTICLWMRFGFDEVALCAVSVPGYPCAGLVITALLFFQIIFAFMIPLIARTSWVVHWPFAAARHATMCALFYSALPLANLNVTVIGISVSPLAAQ